MLPTSSHWTPTVRAQGCNPGSAEGRRGLFPCMESPWAGWGCLSPLAGPGALDDAQDAL